MTDELTPAELDAIDKYWASPTGREYSDYAQTTVRRLVAALRSERTQKAAMRDEVELETSLRRAATEDNVATCARRDAIVELLLRIAQWGKCSHKCHTQPWFDENECTCGWLALRVAVAEVEVEYADEMAARAVLSTQEESR